MHFRINHTIGNMGKSVAVFEDSRDAIVVFEKMCAGRKGNEHVDYGQLTLEAECGDMPTYGQAVARIQYGAQRIDARIIESDKGGTFPHFVADAMYSSGYYIVGEES